MAKIRWLALIVIAAPVSARAQARCTAVVHDLGIVTPRVRANELRLPNAPFVDVMSAGAECSNGLERAVQVASAPFAVHVQSPTIRFEERGGVPDTRSASGTWIGRGANIFVRASASADAGPLHAVLAPEYAYAQNRPFDFLSDTAAGRSGFASAWYNGRYSADLPTRFGAAPLRTLGWGQSALWASVGPVDAGVSSSAQRWGPGRNGGLVLDGTAPGIPRVFLRTGRPLSTPVGTFAADAFYGELTESRFFDRDSTNDARAIRAALLVWSPSDTSVFAIGATHAELRAGAPFGAHHGLARVHGPSDQLNTVFARVRSPAAGVRAWFELGRAGPLPSFQQFTAVPYQGIAYLIGIERLLSYRSGSLLTSLEFANLEQPTDIRGQSTQDFYTSSNIPQGWTQRGQLLGNGAGPGGQSQHASVDWIAPRWSVGFFADRIRWNEDALFRQYLAYPNRHDVTLSLGLRADVILAGQEFALAASSGKRLNYQFQNATYIPGYRTVDVSVPQLTLTITPAPLTKR